MLIAKLIAQVDFLVNFDVFINESIKQNFVKPKKTKSKFQFHLQKLRVEAKKHEGFLENDFFIHWV